LFTSTASGLYLDRLAGDSGIQKPLNIGMPDDLFRQYVIKLTNGKITEQSLLDLMSVFYGEDSVRANSLATIEEPYRIVEGDDLPILFDERVQVNIIFEDEDFAVPGVCAAIEVANAITNACVEQGSHGFAIPYTDPTTSLTYVKLYSGSLGLKSSVR